MLDNVSASSTVISQTAFGKTVSVPVPKYEGSVHESKSMSKQKLVWARVRKQLYTESMNSKKPNKKQSETSNNPHI